MIDLAKLRLLAEKGYGNYAPTGFPTCHIDPATVLALVEAVKAAMRFRAEMNKVPFSALDTSKVKRSEFYEAGANLEEALARLEGS